MGLACARTAGAATGAAASATPPAAACLSNVRRSTPRQFLFVLVIVVLPKFRSFLARFRDDGVRPRIFGRQSTLLNAGDLRGGVSQCQRCLTRRAGPAPAMPSNRRVSLARVEASPYRLPSPGTR